MQGIRIAGITRESVVDGPGFRLVVFTQGCPKECPGCHNVDLRPIEGGKDFTVRELVDEIEQNLSELVQGITFSGGEPLMQSSPLYEVISLLKQRKPGLDIWVYTGYLYEEIEDLPVMELVNVLVDGPFYQEQKDISLSFRGSSNQRIIDVPSTRKAGYIVEWHR